MIPRQITTGSADQFPVLAANWWGAIAIARFHRAEDEQQAGAWSCECRCCQWARRDMEAL